MGSTTSTEGRGCRGTAFGLVFLTAAACASSPPPGGFASPLPRLDVSSEFGARRGVRRVHKGLDLRAPRGTPVSAAGGGRVVFAGWRGAFGRLVIVDHGGDLRTYYAHLSGFTAEKGDRVAPGQAIGLVGASGNASGTHLHFEVRDGDEAVDPRRYLRF